MKWQAEVRIRLKPSVFDPQGNAVENALVSLGHQGVEEVRIGKYLQLRVEAETAAEAEAKVKTMCDAVLCNPVMETYDLTVAPAVEALS
jgi:phosphoribosylformylglycinamidine synthase subunit PurS